MQRSPGGGPVADLYDLHAPKLLTYVRRYIFSREDAEDIVLEVFIAALESSSLLSLNEDEQRAWLWRVTSNKIADYQRRATRHVVTISGVATDSLLVDDELAPDHVTLRNEEHQLLRVHFAQLPPLQQEILRLRFASGLRCTEIAQQLHKHDGAVRMLLSRALNLLRGIYATQPEGHAHDE